MKSIYCSFVSLLVVATTYAGNVTVQNLNNASDAAYGIFDRDGTLYPTGGDTTIRFGVSSLDDAEIISAYSTGDLTAIDNSFTDFGSTFQILADPAIDGVFQSAQDETTTDFVGQNMVIWISSELTFTSNSAQYLMYRFDQSFGAEPFSSSALLGTSSGNLLIGQFGNYSHDYGFGGGSLLGFNTVSAVPEPHQAALVLGFSILAVVYFRKRKNSKE